MATNKYDDLSSINETRKDWKIKVRVVRLWRGATREGKLFSSFNIMLIDKQVKFIQQSNLILDVNLFFFTMSIVTNGHYHNSREKDPCFCAGKM